jgi:drug/metabolite transporter (DMT)-like permease
VAEVAAVETVRPRRLARRLPVGPYAAVWLAIAGWSVCALLVRAAHADATRFTTWRLWFALPPVFVLVALRARRNPHVLPFARRRGRARHGAWAGAMALGGLFFAGGALTAFAAIDRTTLLDATLIPSLQPVVVIAVAATILHEVVTRRLVGLCLVAVAGTALVAAAASGRGTWSLAGDLLAVASLLLNAAWHVYGRWIRHRLAPDPLVFMAGTLAFAAVFMTPVALASGGVRMDAAAVGYAALVMVIGTGAHVTMLWAHRWVPASESAPVMLGEPAMVAFGGWLAFGDAPGAAEIAGSLVVLGALVAVSRSAVVERVEDDALEPAV